MLSSDRKILQVVLFWAPQKGGFGSADGSKPSPPDAGPAEQRCARHILHIYDHRSVSKDTTLGLVCGEHQGLHSGL